MSLTSGKDVIYRKPGDSQSRLGCGDTDRDCVNIMEKKPFACGILLLF